MTAPIEELSSSTIRRSLHPFAANRMICRRVSASRRRYRRFAICNLPCRAQSLLSSQSCCSHSLRPTSVVGTTDRGPEVCPLSSALSRVVRQRVSQWLLRAWLEFANDASDTRLIRIVVQQHVVLVPRVQHHVR